MIQTKFLMSRRVMGIALSMVVFIAGPVLAQSEPPVQSASVGHLLDARFSHRNQLLRQIDQNQSWRTLFVDRFNQIGTTARFGAPRSEQDSLGLGGGPVSLENNPGSGDSLFIYSVMFFMSNFSTQNACIFEPGSCLRKFISSSADNLDLYNRCEIDPYKAMSQLSYTNGLNVESTVRNLTPLYQETELQIQRLNDRLIDTSDEATLQQLRAERSSLQRDLQRIAEMAWNTRRPMAAQLLTAHRSVPIESFQQGCRRIEQLQMIALLDQDLYQRENIFDTVMEQMRVQGLIFEFSGQLALFTKNVETSEGSPAVLSSRKIRELRRQQLELYANYSLVRLGENSTLNPAGFLYQVDLSTNSQVKTGATLDEETLFLFESYQRDYPGNNDRFSLLGRRNSSRVVTGAELAQLLTEKMTNVENNIQKTNEIIRRNREGIIR